MLSGLLLLNKPAGITSFDCIKKLKKIAASNDLGHGGTLDCFASGLLPVFFGNGLKLTRFFLESFPHLSTYQKTYEGIISFGAKTDTGDPSGQVIEERAPHNLDPAFIATQMQTFVSREYWQVPPNFSAKKIGGQRASDLMRSGQEVELKPCLVTIKNFELLNYQNNQAEFRVTCSKGTYIRSLVNDLALELNELAHLKNLVRTQIGPFSLPQAHSFEQIADMGALENAVLNLVAASSFLQDLNISDQETTELRQGKTHKVFSRIEDIVTQNDHTYRALNQNNLIALINRKANQKPTLLRVI